MGGFPSLDDDPAVLVAIIVGASGSWVIGAGIAGATDVTADVVIPTKEEWVAWDSCCVEDCIVEDKMNLTAMQKNPFDMKLITIL